MLFTRREHAKIHMRRVNINFTYVVYHNLMKLQVQVLIENPGNSYLFQFPPLQSILRRIGSQRVETFLGSYGMDISKKLGPCVVLCNYQSKVLNKRAWLMSRKLHLHGTATWAAGLFREDPSRKRKREGESSLASGRRILGDSLM